MGDRLWPKSLAVGRTREVRYARVLFHETGIHVGDGKPNGNRVATVTMGGPGGIRSDREHVEATAHLLAAAPGLAEALDPALDLLAAYLRGDTGYFEDIDVEGIVEAGEAALAKARGEDRS